MFNQCHILQYLNIHTKHNIILILYTNFMYFFMFTVKNMTFLILTYTDVFIKDISSIFTMAIKNTDNSFYVSVKKISNMLLNHTFVFI